jgi:catechol 2,3-dioxygenase-like lactoylglutathione lyase family enzyme
MNHGQILCGTLTTPDLEAALGDYRDVLGLREVERGTLPADFVASAGAPYALLQTTSGAPGFVRIVEQPLPPTFVPTTTYGWAAFEITVQDVFVWRERVRGAGFDVVGEPKEIPGLPYFVAMQMTGRGKEMIYLNEVRCNTPDSDLPPANAPVDVIFIVILACADRPAALEWYRDKLRLDIGVDYTIAYTMIQSAFGLPADHLSTITMIQNARMPIVEVDGYPVAATVRDHPPGSLPPGNAMVTLAVTDIEALDLDWLAPPAPREGAMYAGQRTGVVRGLAGELIELVEIARPRG